MKRVAVDIGGTFTDCFVSWEGRFVQSKALTTHQNLALGFNEALDDACRQLSNDRATVLSHVDSVRYATTLGTNALIERKGPRIGLLTTSGFESTVPISRGRGYAEGLPFEQVRDLSRAKRPEAIIPIPKIRPVRERIDYAGQVLVDLDLDHARAQLRDLMGTGVQAIVVNFINSVANPAHELLMEHIFLEEYPPEMLGSIPMILSHQVVGKKGEYVRGSSAMIDAFLHSTMYFSMLNLEQNLRENGYKKPVLLVHNTGGMAQLNSTDALQTVHSGPVAGLHAAETLSRQSGVGNMICGDMGGTSFDIGVVVAGGHMHYDLSPVIDRWLVSVPMVHLVTLGSGGGSIAQYDPIFRTIKVGPESAGSDPGPACYNRGGLKPTVTDADLLLGYLDPENYANGQIPLNRRRSLLAFQSICDEIDADVIEAAKRVKQIADGDMAAGLGRELASRGHRAQDFIFLAYGGNGPLHACGIARRAGIGRVLVPPFSSVFSASGAAGLDQMHLHEKTVSFGFFNKNTRSIFSDFDRFNTIAAELADRGMRDLLRQGVSKEVINHRLELDMRYGSQRMILPLDAKLTRLESSDDVLALIERMNVEFAALYGDDVVSTESGVWVTAMRMVSWVELPTLQFDSLLPPEVRLPAPLPVAHRECSFVGVEGTRSTPVYGSDALEPGISIDGPAIITTGSTTYLIEPSWRYHAAAQGAAWFFHEDATATDNAQGGSHASH